MSAAIIRTLTAADAEDALQLFAELTPGTGSKDDYEQMITQDTITLAGAEKSGHIIAMATLYLLPNMTWGGRPFGLIENVITHPDHRGQGHMRAVMNYLHQRAWDANAYKIMLMTGTDTGAKAFYEKLGYSAESKHGMQIRNVPTRTTENHGRVGGAP